MKASQAEQEQLLTLAHYDQQIAQATYVKAHLPYNDQLRELNKDRLEAAEELVAISTALSDAESELSRLESDLEPARSRLERNEKTIAASLIDAKALQAMIEESKHLEGRIANLEDQQLEMMAVVEERSAQVDQARGRRADIENRMRAVMAERDERVATIDKEIVALKESRNSAAKNIGDDLMKLYQRLTDRLGVGAATLKGNRCSGCTLELDQMEMKRISQAALDEIIRCAECGRILIRTKKG